MDLDRKAAFGSLFFFAYLLVASVAASEPPEVERLKSKAIAEGLHRSSTWVALLHAEGGESNISDPTFLLSLPEFSTEAELSATIDFLYSDDANVCRFPARYLWLKEALAAPELPLDQCADVVEFRDRAPLDKIWLVFASENLAQPASMLGHVFLVFRGRDQDGHIIEHAITYYTEVDRFNLPKLLYESTVVGKRGYFSLFPYEGHRRRYVDEEQRSVWEYQLELDEFRKELIQLHMIELKQTELTYFFQDYNCATLISHVLAVSGRQIEPSPWWVTPKDVVRMADGAGLISETRVVIPSRWLVRALETQIPAAERSAIRESVLAGRVGESIELSGTDTAFVRLEFHRAVNHYTYLAGDIDKDRWNGNNQALLDAKNRAFPGKELHVDDRYNPKDSPPERQMALFLQHDSGEGYIGFTIRPISHTVYDDNRVYRGENSLELFATTVRVPLESGGPELERFTIYSIESLTPFDRLTGGISGRFNIAIFPQRDRLLERDLIFGIGGALGFTSRIVSDVDVYILGGGGAGYRSGDAFIYSSLETGMVVREIWNQKTIFSLARLGNQANSGKHHYALAVKHAKYIGKSYSVHLDWERNFIRDLSENTVTLSLKKIF